MAFLCGFSEKREKEQDSRLYQIESLSLVAGVGLEPHDLRVMSPTSYQLLHPAIYAFQPLYGNIVSGICQGRILSIGRGIILFVETMQKRFTLLLTT